MPRKLLPSEVNYRINEYQAGKTTTQIAAELGITAEAVKNFLRKHGIPSHGGNRLDVPTEEIATLYRNGMPEYMIAKRFGVSRMVITRRLKEAGVEKRPIGDVVRATVAARTPEENQRYTEAAHAAVRGIPKTHDVKCRMALGKQRALSHVSPQERVLQDMLTKRGIAVIPQQAIGPYNCDLGTYPVAVEIFGGGWHWTGRHLLRTPERFRYILNAGWHILVVKVEAARHPLSESTADYVATFVEQARRDPSAVREYRVIRGAGELLAAGRADDDQISIVQTLRRRRHADSTDTDESG